MSRKPSGDGRAELAIVIMAAGKGTRLKSRRPKVLHRVGGRPLLGHVIAAAQQIVKPEHIFVIVGHEAEQVRRAVAGTGVQFVGLRGMGTGQGLATTKVEGHGTVAIVSDGPAIALEVTPETPLSVDPHAYVGHHGQLRQDVVTDVNWRTVIGHGSGESVQFRYQGHGLVYVQPAERGGILEI